MRKKTMTKTMIKTPTLYRFLFDRRLKMADVEDAMTVAYVAMHALHGHAAMRLDVSFSINTDGRSVVIDGRTDLGRDVAVVFEGLCSQMFERRHFGVQRTPVPPTSPPGAPLPFSGKGSKRVTSRPRPGNRIVPAKAA